MLNQQIIITKIDDIVAANYYPRGGFSPEWIMKAKIARY